MTKLAKKPRQVDQPAVASREKVPVTAEVDGWVFDKIEAAKTKLQEQTGIPVRTAAMARKILTDWATQQS